MNDEDTDDDPFDSYEVVVLAPLFGERVPLSIDDHANLVRAILTYTRSEAAAGGAADGLCACPEVVVADLRAHGLSDVNGVHVLVISGELHCPHQAGRASIVLSEGPNG